LKKDNCLHNWFVLYTKPRQEIKVLERLNAIGVEVYTPIRIEVRQWSDRKKKVQVPLLPSMVLVRIKEHEIDKVFEVPGVVRFLFEKGKRAKVLNEEVLAMKNYLNNTLYTQQKTIKKGDVVQVPLLNKEAKVLAVQGKKCMARLLNLGAVVSFQLS